MCNGLIRLKKWTKYNRIIDVLDIIRYSCAFWNIGDIVNKLNYTNEFLLSAEKSTDRSIHLYENRIVTEYVSAENKIKIYDEVNEKSFSWYDRLFYILEDLKCRF